MDDISTRIVFRPSWVHGDDGKWREVPPEPHCPTCYGTRLKPRDKSITYPGYGRDIGPCNNTFHGIPFESK